MSGTDFFDDDLIRKRERSGAGTGGGEATQRPGEVPSHSVSDLNLTRMAKRRDELSVQAGTAGRAIDDLRRRQDELEREKQSLEDMVRRQDEFERGKRELIDNLDQSVALLEKQEVQASRMAEIYAGTHQRFRQMLQDMQAIDETAWPEDAVREELNKALVLIDDARKEYHRSLAKIEASGGGSVDAAVSDAPATAAFAPRSSSAPGMRYWIGVGFAVSLPLSIVVVVLFILHVILRATKVV